MTNETDVSPDQPVLPEQPEDPGQPHNALFYKTFSKPENAAAELQRVMKPELAARIQWSTLELESNLFVDAKLSSRYSDILFSARMGSKKLLIYVLFEHKSTNDWWTLLQLLEYMARIWRTYSEDKSNKGSKHLPVILPVVFHHSEQGWTSPVRFREYFQVDSEEAELLAPYMLDFGVLLDDIGNVDAEMIARLPVTPEARVVLFALRFGRTAQNVIENLPSITRDLYSLRQDKVRGELVVAAFIVYLKSVAKISEAELIMALQQSIDNEVAYEILFGIEERVARAEANLREAAKIVEAAEATRRSAVAAERAAKRAVKLAGKLAATREAKREGVVEGQQKMLKEQLTKRFGPLGPNVHVRIDNATNAQLRAMALRILSATSLDEVLGTPKAKRASRR